MAIVYRKARVDEMMQLAEIRWEFKTEGRAGQPESKQRREKFIGVCVEFLSRGISSGDWCYWVASDSGDIVATVFIQWIKKIPKPNILDDSFGYMTNVYTKPGYRGCGIGSALLEEVEKWAKAENLEFLLVWPSEESVDFYRNAGFEKSQALEYEARPYIE
jgi:GNAT superfamily N-acetyltransferase